jgi:2'-5' RNA ligase
MVRCFIGFLLPENVKKYVNEIQKEVAQLPVVCKFVEVENLHICLSFLGEVSEYEIDNISESLDKVCKNYPKFEVVVGGIKTIPNENYIRVLALDVSEETGMLEKIRKEIAQKIGGDSKPPHLTLCRVKNISDKENVVKKIREIGSGDINFTVAVVQLMKSELKKAGPVYSAIHESTVKD